MPRPGPRPYECVRRAWHSDRHQPMRGSLIQEIFRVVNEIHSPATKKNKEWQEKLPVVVLKSEEIMYSKANSEAEYMDLETLCDRTTDAINTIIRLDETAETGELLPPCIEAALNLGCMPRRTTRSQRNSNPRCYLNAGTQEPAIIDNFTQHTANSQCMPYYPTFMKPKTMDTTQNHVVQNNNGSTNKFPFASKNVSLSSNKQCLPTENFPTLNPYPLYYGSCFKIEEPSRGIQNFPNSTSNTMEPAEMNVVQNTSFSVNSSTDIPDNPHDIECDLSLRLGPLSIPCPSDPQQQVEEVGFISPEAKKFSDLTLQSNKKLETNFDDPLDICSSQWSTVKGNLDTKTRKRKAVSTQTLEDQHFCWQSKLQHHQLTGRMNNAGL